MEQYPMIALLLRHGRLFAIGVAVLPALAAVWAYLWGWDWPVLLAGAIAAALVFCLMKSYVELVHVIADMLLPK